MNDRYYGKVVATTDRFTLVMNKGSENGVELGDKFLVVGLGQSIIDSDTQEELGRLEVLRGHVKVSHVQERISTARSCEFEQHPDVSGINNATPPDTSGTVKVAESREAVITHVERKVKELDGAQIGDFLLKQ